MMAMILFIFIINRSQHSKEQAKSFKKQKIIFYYYYFFYYNKKKEEGMMKKRRNLSFHSIPFHSIPFHSIHNNNNSRLSIFCLVIRYLLKVSSDLNQKFIYLSRS